MIDTLLKPQLEEVFHRQRGLRLALRLSVCWATLALIGLSCPRSSLAILVLAIVAGILGIIAFVLHKQSRPDWHDIARRIELKYPELNGLLLTAVEQQPAADGQLQYLQQRIVREALNHSRSNSWAATIPGSRLAAAQGAQIMTLVFFLCVLFTLRSPDYGKSAFGKGWTADGVTITPGDTSIERGERLVVVASFSGSPPPSANLVIPSTLEKPKQIPLTKSLSDPVFGAIVPEVTTNFVYRLEYGRKQTRDFTVKVFEYPRLERADADLTFPAYTGLAPKRVENTHRISAVEGTHCKLTLQLNKPVARAQFIVKGDASNIIPLVVASNHPTATLANLTLETNRTYLLQLVDAEGRTNRLPAQFVVDALKNREPELKIASPRGDTRPSALEEVSFEGSVWDDFGVQAYGLAYTQPDGEMKFIELGRGIPANEKRSFKHVLQLEDLGAKPEQLISWFLWADDTGPDGQVRRSAGDMYFAEVRRFEEVFRQGQGQDGGDQQGESGESGGGNRQSQLAELQKQIINATWKLQRQQSRQVPALKPTQPATPDKSSRETSAIEGLYRTPVFFSRPRLVRTAFGQRTTENTSDTPLDTTRQKLSGISGTNKVASSSQFVEDLKVVRDAVEQAISQAQTARQRQTGVRNAALWDDLVRDMEKSLAALDKAVQAPPSLADALAAEQSAFQVLLRLQQREYEVSRNRNRSQSNQSGRSQQMQRQLEQLDLTQPEARYENERLAQSPQSPERREQLQVMNRLAELARRQQDLNDRLKELQTALQEAKTEKEREEIRRQLKRLQEEEQRMLADADELQQRMNQPENQSRMSEQRQQLEQTRQELERAAEAAQQGAPSQALASGTRAQRQLQQMRENMRKQNSSEFAEDLKQLRAEARDAERKQQEIQNQMDSLGGDKKKSLDDSQEREKSLEQLAQQAQRLTNLVSRATQLSQQTEDAEPLASRELYDTLRKFSQDDANSVRRLEDELLEHGLIRTELYQRLTEMEKHEGVKSMELTSELLRQGLLPLARQSGDRARSSVSDLKRGIERAAEKVLGDDTAALSLAKQELEQLTAQLEREMAQSNGEGKTNTQTQASGGGAQQSKGDGQRPSGERSADGQQADGRNQQTPSENPAQQPGKPLSPAETQTVQAGNQQPSGGEARQGENQQPGSGSDNPQAGRERGGSESGSTASAQNRPRNRGARDAVRGGGTNDLARLLDPEQQSSATGRGGGRNGSVITGEDFVPWSDRLREVEEMVEDPSLQNQLATARDHARLMRQEYKRTLEKPEWARVGSDVVKPLVEVRKQISDELARRGSRENLAPIDRDPVPTRFSELVRRYYEALGKDN